MLTLKGTYDLLTGYSVKDRQFIIDVKYLVIYTNIIKYIQIQPNTLTFYKKQI